MTEEEKEFLEAITKIGDEKTKNIILTYISNKKEEYKQKVKNSILKVTASSNICAQDYHTMVRAGIRKKIKKDLLGELGLDK